MRKIEKATPAADAVAPEEPPMSGLGVGAWGTLVARGVPAPCPWFPVWKGANVASDSTPGEGAVDGVVFVTAEKGELEGPRVGVAGGFERPLLVVGVVVSGVGAVICPAPLVIGETTCATVESTGAVTWPIPWEATLLRMAVVPSTPRRIPATVEVATVPTGAAPPPMMCVAV